MNFEDEDELIGGTGGGSRNRNKAKKGKTANASGAGGGGKAPKTHDIGVLISGKLPSLLPRIETTLNTLRSTLSDSLQLVLEQDTDVTKTYKKLVEKKIMETDIDECIKSGKGPHGLGRTKTIYKCFFQFAKRACLVSQFIGDTQCLHADLGYVESKESANESNLSFLVKHLGRNMVYLFGSVAVAQHNTINSN